MKKPDPDTWKLANETLATAKEHGIEAEVLMSAIVEAVRLGRDRPDDEAEALIGEALVAATVDWDL